MSKRYFKIENGKQVWYNGHIVLGDMQIFNPSDEELKQAGYQEYIPAPDPEPTAEEQLEAAIEAKVAEIEAYDDSPAVNECLINYAGQTIPYWRDKNERNALINAVQDCIAKGRPTYRLDLRDFGVSISIPCEVMVGMLQDLECYAIDCYNRTTDHIYAVRAKQTVEEVEAYDYTLDYPAKPIFNLS